MVEFGKGLEYIFLTLKELTGLNIIALLPSIPLTLPSRKTKMEAKLFGSAKSKKCSAQKEWPDLPYILIRLT